MNLIGISEIHINKMSRFFILFIFIIINLLIVQSVPFDAMKANNFCGKLLLFLHYLFNSLIRKFSHSALKNCENYSTRIYDYIDFHAIKDISSKIGKNDGYYVNLKVFVIAKRNVHILLAQSESDTRLSYEIGTIS